jgi:uncharacterized membrane protein
VEINLRVHKIICIGVLLALGLSGLALGLPFLEDENTTAATVHGITYAWDTLEPINDTVIYVNSNPPQSIVAKDGTYSFELKPGDYIITASYYRNNTLVYSKETTIRIENGGSYVLDLLLYPVSENEVTGTSLAKINNPNGGNPPEQTGTSSSATSYLPVALAFLLLFGGGYKLFKKDQQKKTTSQEGRLNAPGFLVEVPGKSAGSGIKPKFGNIGKAASVTEPLIETVDNSEIEAAALKKHSLSTDLREVLDIIRGHKGKITQKNLRSRLNYSEVKVSLMLSELEKRGLIKKLKKGRENIVILVEEEP